MTVPYATATSGEKARDEILKILRRFGCESVGFMDDFQNHEVMLAFKHRGRPIQLRASARGWASLLLKEKPFNPYRKRTKEQYLADALRQGQIAVNSILRDWIKGQVTAVETGVLSFEDVFLPHMLTGSGKTFKEFVEKQKLIPAPQEAK